MKEGIIFNGKQNVNSRRYSRFLLSISSSS